jgi:thiol-disulfide isomerase/thioredoxin
MKYIKALLILCLTYNSTIAQEKFILKGKIEGRNGTFIYLSYLDKNEQFVIDSGKIINSYFLFTGFINGAVNAEIYEKNSTKKLNVNSFYLEPGKLKILIIEKGFKVKGSITQKENEELNILYEPAYKALDSVSEKLNEISLRFKIEGKTLELINKQKMLQVRRLELRELERKIAYKFLSDNPKSYLNPQILSYYLGAKKISLDSAKIIFNQFDIKVQKSILGELFLREMNGKIMSATGQIAPIFVKTDINGNEIILSNYRDSSYVILDFWASWCIPCRKFSPTLKSYYQKYHSKGLEIISVSWDSDIKVWEDAIKDDGMYIWRNILANMYLPKDNSMRDKFGVPSIPLLILIDKKGVILGRYMAPNEDGGQTELEIKLEKIFN